MKVLYVVGTNLRRNTSANISHNAYVQGLLDNNCDVDIIMASSSWGEEDSSLPEWDKANYYTYNSVSSIENLKHYTKKIFDKKNQSNFRSNNIKGTILNKARIHFKWKGYTRSFIKNIYTKIFNPNRLYNLNITWLKNASKFKKEREYDIVISNSTPAASHKLVMDLLSKKHIKCKRWIQIWEDPWFFDLYAGHDEKVKQEEHRLLKAAKEIFYVSTLTLEYQKTHFKDCAHKMNHIPLPYLQMGENKPRNKSSVVHFGYFGDYFSITRNIVPFYQALIEINGFGYIYGDSDLSLETTKTIEVCGRVTIDKLVSVQEKSDVLVHLCNVKGGQIPGKIYHYSATTKPILFILDGTPDEIVMIKSYFEKYNRFHFCNNNLEEIVSVMKSFTSGIEEFEKQPVSDFHPCQVISKLLNNK